MDITANRLLSLRRNASREGRELSFKAIDSHFFGLFKSEDDITLSEAAKRLDADKKVRLEEVSKHQDSVSYSTQWIWQKNERQHSGVVTRTQRAHTDLESGQELEEFHAFKVEGTRETERQKLADQLEGYDTSGSWSLSNTEDPLFGKREAGELGLSAFEAADRISSGEVVSVNRLHVSRLIEGMVRGDTDMVAEAVDNHFVASPVDLEAL